jgi:hypothetical protein
VQAKGMCNILKKKVVENFATLEKLCPFRYKKLPGNQTD